MNKKKGIVYFIGAGPGDVDLITVKGQKVLKQADTIIYDYLVNKEILKNTREGCELICVNDIIKGNKNRQEMINKVLIKKSNEGKKIVRLKNGDPFIFGHANEEMEALTKEKIEYRIIPGITAGIAAGCYTGIPLTSRDCSSNVVFITGHQSGKRKLKWKHIANIETIVIYMGAENLIEIITKLVKNGLKLKVPVAIIINTTKINQKTIITTAKEILEKKVKINSPAIIIIGKVVIKEKKFNWLKRSKKVLFTGLSEERYFENEIYYHNPYIMIEPLDDYLKLDKEIKRINKYKWIVFASRYGVYYFFDRLFKNNYDARKLQNIKIAAIGSSTANKLKEYGIIADLIPVKENSDGLVNELKNKIKNKKILLLRSDIADKGLKEKLKRYKAKVKTIITYKNKIPDEFQEIDLNIFNSIMFTSPSTVRNFLKIHKKVPENIEIRYIGAVTSNEAKKLGLFKEK